MRRDLPLAAAPRRVRGPVQGPEHGAQLHRDGLRGGDRARPGHAGRGLRDRARGGHEPRADQARRRDARARCSCSASPTRAPPRAPTRRSSRSWRRPWPAALADLRARFDVVVCEGAGSPAEINLRAADLANLGLARRAGLPVLLVGDIDRGGVFPALYGTRRAARARRPGARRRLPDQQVPRRRVDPRARARHAPGAHGAPDARRPPLARRARSRTPRTRWRWSRRAPTTSRRSGRTRSRSRSCACAG